MDIELVLDAGAIIGESPTWVAAGEGALLDRCEEAGAISLRPATGRQRSWPLPSDIGAFVCYPSGPAPWSRYAKEFFDWISQPDR